MLRPLTLKRLQLSVLTVLTTLSPAAHGSQLPWEQSPIYLREQQNPSFTDLVFGSPQLAVAPAPISGEAEEVQVTPNTEALSETELASILPGFVQSSEPGQWNSMPLYYGFGGIPPSAYLVSPYESMDLTKPFFDPRDPIFLPSTYFDNDPALKASEVGIAI